VHGCATTDARRVPFGDARGRRVVGARGDEQGAIPLERVRHEGVEVRLVARPQAACDAAAARHRDQVGAQRGRRRLPAGDLVHAVVEHHDDQVARADRGDRAQAAELHQQRAVALQREHPALRLRDRHAQRDRRRQAHAAQHVEVLRALPARPQVEVGVADAADHRFLAVQPGDQAPGEVGAAHLPRLRAAARIGEDGVHDGLLLSVPRGRGW